MMVRSKTRNLLTNIQMAVKVSRFSSPSHIHQFPCHVSSSSLTILNSKRSTIYYLTPKSYSYSRTQSWQCYLSSFSFLCVESVLHPSSQLSTQNPRSNSNLFLAGSWCTNFKFASYFFGCVNLNHFPKVCSKIEQPKIQFFMIRANA